MRRFTDFLLGVATLIGFIVLGVFVVRVADAYRPAAIATATFTKIHKGESSTLVVFMHGLCGHPIETYKSPSGPSWPELMATDKDKSEGSPPLGSHSIALLGYDPPNVSITIPAIVDKLRVEMDSHKISHIYDHIVIIAHSLGGVAMIDMLPNLKEQDPIFHSKLRAVFLIGTPAQGSPWANAMSAIASILPSNVACLSSVLDLRTVGLNAYLDSINRRWNFYMKERQSQPRIYCAYEGRAVANLAVPVPKEHIPAHCDEPVWGFDGDHNRMVKPESRSEDMYVWVKRHINRVIGDATAFNKTRAIDDILALHTTASEVDDFVGYNIRLAERTAKVQLGCSYKAELKPSVRLVTRRTVESFVQSASKPLRTMLEQELSDVEIQKIIDLERTQYTARRTLAAMPSFDEVDDIRLKHYFNTLSPAGRRKYETVRQIWALTRAEEVHSEAIRFIRTIPPGILGVQASKLERDTSRLKTLAMAKQAHSFIQEELDRVLVFFAPPLGKNIRTWLFDG